MHTVNDHLNKLERDVMLTCVLNFSPATLPENLPL